MKGFHLSILAILLFMPSVLALECYTCYSSKSWDDCLKVQRKKSCEDLPGKSKLFSVCAKVSKRKRRKNGQEEIQYAKFCYIPDQCSVAKCRDDDRKHYNATWCEIECCRKSNCNTGKTESFRSRAGKNLVSGAVMAFCVLGFLVNPGLF